MEKETKKIIIIDANSVIHRAFHALPPLFSKEKGLVNAVYGFLLVFLKALKEFNPDFVVACFDFPAITFRHKKFKGYKAKRPPAPKELYSQIPKVKDVLEVFNVQTLEKEGFEADDIIATASKKFSQKQVFPKAEKVILSGDLDSLQLVDKDTKVLLLKKGVKNTLLYNEEMVKEKYEGLVPSQLVDFRALRGDASDNIPGVKGVGDKTAIFLLKRFKTLEQLYQALEKGGHGLKEKLKDSLLVQKDKAFLSKELAEISKNVPLEIDFKKCYWKDFKKAEVINVFKEFEFYSLIKKIPGVEKDIVQEKNLTLW